MALKEKTRMEGEYKELRVRAEIWWLGIRGKILTKNKGAAI